MQEEEKVVISLRNKMYKFKLKYAGFTFGKFFSFLKNNNVYVKFFLKLYKKQFKYAFFRSFVRRFINTSYLNSYLNLKCFIFAQIFFYIQCNLYFFNFFL